LSKTAKNIYTVKDSFLKMPKCSKCGIIVREGEYLDIDGKIICFDCNAGREVMTKTEKPKIITCPYCENEYDIDARICPKCEEYNPIYDFHFFEFFVNVGIGYIAIFVPLFVLLSVFQDIRYSFGILISPIFFLYSFIAAIVFACLFYLGRWIRGLFRKKKQAGPVQ
jgi:hypothetical protein